MREIQLNTGLGRFTNESPFAIGDLELYISNLPMVSGDFRLITWCNGAEIGTYTLTHDDPRATISRSLLSAGTFSCRVDHYNNDTLVRHYLVEDLTIIDLNTDLIGVPEIVDIQENISKLKDRAAALEARAESLETGQKAAGAEHDNLVSAHSDTREVLLKVIKWAYEVQKEIPYLDGDELDAFLKKCGISLTDEEKNIIGGSEDEL